MEWEKIVIHGGFQKPEGHNFRLILKFFLEHCSYGIIGAEPNTPAMQLNHGLKPWDICQL